MLAILPTKSTPPGVISKSAANVQYNAPAYSSTRRVKALTSVTLFRRHSDGDSLSSSGQRKQVEKKVEMTRKKSSGFVGGCRRFEIGRGRRTMVTICEVCLARLALNPNGNA